MSCVYDDTLADDCKTPLYGSDSALADYADLGTTSGSSQTSSLLAQVQSVQSSNPVASGVGSSSGGSALSNIFSSVLNFGSTAIKSFAPTPTQSNLRLQVNPTTGLQQYYNPSTGQYVGSPINSTSSLFGGSNSFLLVIVAVIVAIFAFGGFRRKTA